MTFLRFLKMQLLGALLSGFALGILLAVLLLFTGGVGGEVNLDIELGAFDGFWALLALPALLLLLVLLASPLAFGLMLLLRRVKLLSD